MELTYSVWLGGGLFALTVVALVSLWYDIQARRASTAWKEYPNNVVDRILGLDPRSGSTIDLAVTENVGVAAINTQGLRRLAVSMDETHRQQVSQFEQQASQFERINRLLAEIREADFTVEKPTPPPTQWERILND